MRILFFLFNLLFYFSCAEINSSQDSNGNVPNEKISYQVKDGNDSLGEKILTIDFKVKAIGEELATFTDGIVPWISIQSPQKKIANLIDADEKVLSYSSAQLVIDYPLKSPVKFDIKSLGKGFTRKELIMAISDHYNKLYKEEELSALADTTSNNNSKGSIYIFGKAGKYGIWGHYISDLDLSSILVYKNKEGLIILSLIVES